jgi:DNA invertase Pin-like site-specific DNA recombinase
MTIHLDPPLAPRHGRTLKVLGICRISTVHQDEKSLEDQEALLRRFVRDHYDGPVEWEIVAGRGSGEYLDRADLARAEALIESRAFDLVVAEDLARLCRRVRAYEICEMAQDCGTRLVAINDNVDTAREDWHLGALFSVFRHESYTRDTGKRIRRTLRNRFEQGGVVQCLPYGYIKPPGAKSDTDVSKDPAAAEAYDMIFRRLEEGASFREVADALNARGIPTGPWSRSDRWTGPSLAQVVRNPILKGVRRRNQMVSERVHRTGRRKSVKAPRGEQLYREVPHLAFIEPARYDRLVAELADRNEAYGRGRRAKATERPAPASRKRTAWPGQHVTCGACGRPFYWGGHG